MDHMTTYDAIVFPCDDRPPHVVPLMTSPLPAPVPNPAEPYRCGRMPHPEIYMDYIAEGLGPQSWRYHIVDKLDGMTKKFPAPYILFYPVISRDGMAFPINKCIREVQGSFYKESAAWRGNIVVAKYVDSTYSAMVELSMADFPILKNYLSTRAAP
ncbi:hypothetical protein EIP91_003218 [Steccherinum ochraceum]|uniref:Uncharacterized protein n=1 Tax=Steccherinum ochraceum TaxID=92696 RepID=A0A4V2MXK5_9APHY|nr:hypothetical protein EIP91_003218 [Steccherinum ochraceum]